MFHSGLLQHGCLSLIAAEMKTNQAYYIFKGCEYFYFWVFSGPDSKVVAISTGVNWEQSPCSSSSVTVQLNQALIRWRKRCLSSEQSAQHREIFSRTGAETRVHPSLSAPTGACRKWLLSLLAFSLSSPVYIKTWTGVRVSLHPGDKLGVKSPWNGRFVV